MRTTLIIDDDLLSAAREATGLRTKTAVVEAGLRALVAQAARRRVEALKGTVPDASAPERRRGAPKRRSDGEA
jgi:Arc/MetJ family transcription regulator